MFYPKHSIGEHYKGYGRVALAINILKEFRMPKTLFAKKIRRIFFLYKHSKREKSKYPIKISVLNQLRMWEKGFLGDSYVVYSFEDNDPKDYLSDYARLKITPKINGIYSTMLNDKLYFTRIMGNFEDYLPKIYGLINRGRIVFFDDTMIADITTITGLCREEGNIVLKPIKGGGGKGVIIIRTNQDVATVNGRELPFEEALSTLNNLDGYLISEFIRQGEYSSRIFPHTTNTVRVLSMWDEQENDPFIAVAVHRFGTSLSKPVDNWTQGGLSSPIDLKTGELGKAVSYPFSGTLDFRENHPETKTRISGVVVPRWKAIKAKILGMAKSLPFIPYIGWDIVVTEDSFKVIEGNNHSAIDLFQVHCPLLKNRRIKEFYQQKGVLEA